MFFDARRGSLLHFIGWGEEEVIVMNLTLSIKFLVAQLPSAFILLPEFFLP
jgi:hypothetical protein